MLHRQRAQLGLQPIVAEEHLVVQQRRHLRMRQVVGQLTQLAQVEMLLGVVGFCVLED